MQEGLHQKPMYSSQTRWEQWIGPFFSVLHRSIHILFFWSILQFTHLLYKGDFLCMICISIGTILKRTLVGFIPRLLWLQKLSFLKLPTIKASFSRTHSHLCPVPKSYVETFSHLKSTPSSSIHPIFNTYHSFPLTIIKTSSIFGLEVAYSTLVKFGTQSTFALVKESVNIYIW